MSKLFKPTCSQCGVVGATGRYVFRYTDYMYHCEKCVNVWENTELIVHANETGAQELLDENRQLRAENAKLTALLSRISADITCIRHKCGYTISDDMVTEIAYTLDAMRKGGAE